MVRLYGERLYWKVRHMVLYHDDANDVLQNTFIKAWSNLSTFQNRAKPLTWLFSIAIHEALDHLRRRKLQLAYGSDEPSAHNHAELGAPSHTGQSVAAQLTADEYFDGDEAEALLLEAIDTLPDVQRTVFTLRYYDNMKYSDMSVVLGTSVGALKASYHIAVKKITDYLKDRTN